MPLWLQDIQASELAHAELEESAAARHRQREDDQQRATAARKEKEVLEAAVAAAERRLMVLQQQAQVWVRMRLAAVHMLCMCCWSSTVCCAQAKSTMGRAVPDVMLHCVC